MKDNKNDKQERLKLLIIHSSGEQQARGLKTFTSIWKSKGQG